MNEIKLIDWLSITEDLIKIGFTKEEIEKALEESEYTEIDLTDDKGFENFNEKWYNPCKIIKERHKFTTKKYQGEYSKDVEVQGKLVRIRGEYQSLKHPKIIEILFSNKFEWFKDFTEPVVEKQKPEIRSWTRLKDIPLEYKNLTLEKLIELSEPLEITVNKSLWRIYSSFYNDPEMYLETEFGTLYVPYEALMESDFSIIEERMNSYFSSYFNKSGFNLNHRGRTLEEYEKDQEQSKLKALKALESKEALKLKNYLKKWN